MLPLKVLHKKFKMKVLPDCANVCAPTRVCTHPQIWTPWAYAEVGLQSLCGCVSTRWHGTPLIWSSLCKKNNNNHSVILFIKITLKTYEMSLTYYSAVSWHWEWSASCKVCERCCSAIPWNQHAFHLAEVMPNVTWGRLAGHVWRQFRRVERTLAPGNCEAAALTDFTAGRSFSLDEAEIMMPSTLPIQLVQYETFSEWFSLKVVVNLSK